jgi:hypothetical protein
VGCDVRTRNFAARAQRGISIVTGSVISMVCVVFPHGSAIHQVSTEQGFVSHAMAREIDPQMPTPDQTVVVARGASFISWNAETPLAHSKASRSIATQNCLAVITKSSMGISDVRAALTRMANRNSAGVREFVRRT